MNLLANTVVFIIARQIGHRFEGLMNVNKQSGKLSFLYRMESPGFMVALASLVPVVPNGIIPYIAAKAGISFKSFVTGIAIGSIPNILVLNSIGNKIIKGDFTAAALLFGFMLIGIISLYKLQKPIIAWYEKLTANARNKKELNQ